MADIGTDRRERWHVGKEIPLALVALIVGQTLTIVWWSAKIDSRVTHLEVSHSTFERRMDKREEEGLRLVKVEQNLINVTGELNRVTVRLDALLDALTRQAPPRP